MWLFLLQLSEAVNAFLSAVIFFIADLQLDLLSSIFSSQVISVSVNVKMVSFLK